MKNATEGIANPRLIVPFSVLLFGGSVLPVVTLVWSIVAQSPLAIAFSIVGVLSAICPEPSRRSDFGSRGWASFVTLWRR